MRTKYLLPSLAAIAMALAAVPSASAVSKYYEVAGGSVNGNFSSDPGLVVHTNQSSNLAGTSFNLNDGGSSTFAFFDIWTDETTVNDDDRAFKFITATLNFSDPLTGATVNGITVGGTLLFGLAQWGQVRWGPAITITLPGDRVFDVSFSDEIFNLGLFGLSNGYGCGATVRATVTQRSSTAAVPDNGGTVMLLGLALSGMALVSRKRAAAVRTRH